MKLVIAGDGDLYERLKNDQKNNPSIELVGRLDFKQVMRLYACTDIFVYPSLYPEGLPTSVLEAGLMKNAVIATPRGGTEEVIVDESHGIIVDGSAQSLQSAMTRLIDDPRVREMMSNKIYKRVTTVFTWDKVAQDINVALKGFDRQS